MKQEIPTTPPRRPPPKSSTVAAASTSRSKRAIKAKESPRAERDPGGVSSSPNNRARATPVRQDVQTTQKAARRPVSLNKARNGEESCGSRMNQYGGLMQRRSEIGGVDPDAENEDLRRKVAELEGSVADLKAEVGGLKAELEVARRLNTELQAVNGKLSEDLACAEANLSCLSSTNQGLIEQKDLAGQCQSSKFQDIQKIIACKLQPSKSSKEPPAEPPPVLQPWVGLDTQKKASTAQCSQSPPPPPPTPLRLPQRAGAPGKPSSVIQFYHSLSKREGNQNFASQTSQYKPVASSAHNSIVGEIKNRSTHLLAIKADIETKGDFINGLIKKVEDAAYTDISDVLDFVNWLDNQLSTLVDERAVLKHFEWPEGKADAMREAAVEYRDLKPLVCEVSSYVDDAAIPPGIALKKMVDLLDKSEQRIQRLIKLRSSAKRSYQKYNIPLDWMLDSGLVGVIKQALMKVANFYLKRVVMELQTLQNSDRESTRQALMIQGLHFAYRTYQLAGGLDSETTRALEEIRQQLPKQHRGSREVLASIPSLQYP